MTVPVSPDDLSARRQRIRLEINDLARRAGKDPETVRRVLRQPGSGLRGTHKAIGEALAAEEIALRDHLLELHPLDKVVTRIDARELARLADDGGAA